MKTEAEIIYTIWDIVRGGETNSDDPINERLMRQFLSIHRGRMLNEAYKKGDTLGDECFQSLGAINFTKTNGIITSNSLPKIIRFSGGYYGMMFDKNGYTISVLNSEEFSNAKYNKFNKFQPRLKYLNNKLTFNIGKEQDCEQHLDDMYNSFLNTTVRSLKAEDASNTLSINGQAVLVNPDDENGYDFTSSPYPMPDELIENLVNSVNAREFNIFLQVKSDETGDQRFNISEKNTREEI